MYLLGDYADAVPLCQRALAICARGRGPDHPNTAMSLHHLAGVYQAQGRYGGAEPLYRRALALRERVLGPEPAHRRSARGLRHPPPAQAT